MLSSNTSLFIIAIIRMMELTERHRKERELETERLCSAQQQSERVLETKERAHRQQLNALEEQVSQLCISYFIIGSECR